MIYIYAFSPFYRIKLNKKIHKNILYLKFFDQLNCSINRSPSGQQVIMN